MNTESIFAEYSEQELYERDQASWALDDDAETEADYELWLETRYSDSINAEPWWAQ